MFAARGTCGSGCPVEGARPQEARPTAKGEPPLKVSPEWFAPRRYGYGAGLPISWQGWALTAGYLLLLGIGSAVMSYSSLAFISMAAIVTIAFLVVCARTTRG